MPPQEFFRRFVATRTPVVVRGHLRDAAWKGALWSDDHLRAKAGGARVMVERRGPNGGFGSGQPKEEMSFGDLLTRLARDDGLYLTTQPQGEGDDDDDDDEGDDIPLAAPPVDRLLDEFPMRPSLLGSLVPHQVNMWVGANAADGTSSGLHHDFHDNLYVLLRGAKRFTLFSPADAGRVPSYGSLRRVHPSGVFNYAGLRTRGDGAPVAAVARRRMEAADRRVNELRERGEKADPDEVRRAEEELDAALEGVLDAGGDDGGNDEGMFEMGGEEEEDEEEEEEEEENGDGDAAAAAALGLALGDDDDDDDDDDLEEETNTSGHPDNFCPVSVAELRRVVPYPKGAPTREPGDAAAEFVRGEGLDGLTPGVVELVEGDMLYLPAGWFHEVTSYGGGSRVHAAFNYWFHPPTTADAAAPYEDAFWADEHKAALARVRARLAKQQGK